jgi:hypothetical protein
MKSITRIITILAFLTAFLIFSPPTTAQAVNCTWNGTNGNWNDQYKWTCNQVPGEEDDVFFPSGTLSVNESVKVKSFTQSGGYLDGAGNLTADTVTWSAGWMRGTGSTTALEEAKFLGTNALTLDGRTFNNAGMLSYSRSSSNYLYLYTAETVFNNLPGATFSIDDGIGKAVGGSGTFNNEGRVVKTSLDDTIQISGAFINTGVIEVDSGTLQIFHTTVAAPTGSFDVHSDATLQLMGMTQTLTGNIAAAGAGTIEINNAGNNQMVIDGTFTFPDGTLSLPYSATLNLSTPATTVNVGTFNESGGHLTGPGSLTAHTINWSGGTQSGTGVTTATHEVFFTGTSIVRLDGRTFNNAGTALWNKTGTSGSGYLSLLTAESTFNNQSGATFTVQLNGPTFISGAGTFNNAGTLTKSSPDTTQINAVFVNTSLVKVDSGLLEIKFISPTGASTGHYEVLSGAYLRLSGSDHNLTGDIDCLGEGNIDVATTINLDGKLTFPGTFILGSNGVLNLSTDATTADVGILNLSLGTLTGPGDLTAGTINWSAGTMSGSGSTTASSAANFTGTGNITLNDRTFNNAGAATWNRTGAGYLYFQTAASVFNNQSGATFTVQSSGPVITYGNGMFNNAGTLNLTTGEFGIHTLTQSSGGTTNLAIRGVTPFTNYSRFVTTHVELAGELNVTFTGGYTPQVGDRYILLTYSSDRIGDYSPVHVSPVGDIAWVRYYEGNALNLEAGKYRCFAPIIMK